MYKNLNVHSNFIWSRAFHFYGASKFCCLTRIECAAPKVNVINKNRKVCMPLFIDVFFNPKSSKRKGLMRTFNLLLLLINAMIWFFLVRILEWETLLCFLNLFRVFFCEILWKLCNYFRINSSRFSF